MKTEVMLFARDVPKSSRFYQELLGARSGHGGSEYERIVDGSELLLQLHHLEAEEHAGVALGDGTPRGAGVVLYLSVEDVRAVHARATEMGAQVVSEPTFIDLAGHTEFMVRDPDGYTLAVYSPGRA